MDTDFYRMKRLPPYVIAEVNAMRHAARQGGEDIIDLGMGNPDQPPPAHVIEKLCEVAKKPDAHGYSQSKGIPGLRKAQANYYGRRFGVELDPEREVVVTMGSKEGLASLANAITAPGDVVLAPNPSYPIHTFGFIIAGATIRSVPTTPDEQYWAALESAMNYTVPRPSVLVVNYPSNPTAEVVDLAFYERLVDWARDNEVWILSDLAYSELYYDGKPTPSIMQVKGAKDVAIEFTSMSKTYSMAGWRMGFAVGNQQLIAAMTRVKSYLDYGAFTPIQAAACAALNGPQDIVETNRQLYHKRRDVMVDAFARAGWEIPSPAASMFAWAPLPPALAHMGSLDFSKRLLTEAKVAVAAGVGYGEKGEGFVRIAMVENEQRLRQAARNIKKYFNSLDIKSSAA
ncbi:MAG: LL-diaminopimelate aminotransferase [Proteobacteria bacterium]|jgi:alanine-synthesizing transaminase|uniref:LL-diaminopimelate aminotransferase n=1 Tax=uncultured Altererythrobacter sp. TaxID=500840 RepID=UPI000D7986D5|nr:LL-diaminopimelate aminotransferase [uncultured Altererythrobacter sp.]MDA0820641.1 LL-diaminopimelate aminotransferase [Pseudomonadota bacterium]MDA0914755.1 LL-diaminopimelate aminotransferase [Pseudomonadota bacterium]MDA1033684.1 LL-diaminopimelate aminotransferase [Pseudomonadota bacterium]PWL24856.1 MAG: LL-diaminopimelate aminotransferase [Altererythrobacter sp. XM-24bin4]